MAPLMVVLAVAPVLVVVSLLAVAVLMMTPALVALVAARRFGPGAQKAGLSSRVWPGRWSSHGAGPRGAGGVGSAVAGSAAGPRSAALDLGVADLPGDGI